jgi:hypothetical protein
MVNVLAVVLSQVLGCRMMNLLQFGALSCATFVLCFSVL